MLEFHYDFLDYYLPHEDFKMVEMDTDSNYLGISTESIEDLIKPKLREEFEREKHNWFITPRVPKENVPRTLQSKIQRRQNHRTL